MDVVTGLNRPCIILRYESFLCKRYSMHLLSIMQKNMQNLLFIGAFGAIINSVVMSALCRVYGAGAGFLSKQEGFSCSRK